MRTLRYGKRGGKFHVLFAIRGDTFHVLTVRHSARQGLAQEMGPHDAEEGGEPIH